VAIDDVISRRPFFHFQAAAFLQKQNAGGRELLPEPRHSELGTDSVLCAPFFITPPVRLLEGNFPVDPGENGAAEIMVRGFRSDVSICLSRTTALWLFGGKGSERRSRRKKSQSELRSLREAV